jgi:hypothetical protein
MAVAADVVSVTGGRSLHHNMRDLVRRFLDARRITGFQDLEDWGYSPT